MSDARMRQPVYAPVDFLIITALPEEREALLGLLPVFLGSKRHFCADSLPLVEKNVAQN
jgi:hypothetical protein